MDRVTCFLLEPLEIDRVWLRRYVRGDEKACEKAEHGYHQARTLIGDLPARFGERGGARYRRLPIDAPPGDDPRWPRACVCGYVFHEYDEWQVFNLTLWRRVDTGATCTLRDAPPGAMWFASWMEDVPSWCGPDGRALLVKLPDGREWHIDGQAANCTLPEDKAHKCWVRHGAPPRITVDKNGRTCAAGAGSIATPTWHGFLRDGELIPC